MQFLYLGVKFANRIWWIWRWRNDAVFRDRTTPLYQKISWLAQRDREIAAAFAKRAVPGTQRTTITQSSLAWRKPHDGWLKLNVDGSRSSSIGMAGCGGVLRDHHGDWVCGFQQKIGYCSSDEAEALGMLQGLRLLATLGTRYVIVESDSASIIDSLRSRSKLHGNIGNILQRCQTAATNFEEIHFEHIYREQNKLADALAKRALCLPRGYVLLTEAPNDLRDLICDDKLGACSQRWIPQDRDMGSSL